MQSLGVFGDFNNKTEEDFLNSEEFVFFKELLPEFGGVDVSISRKDLIILKKKYSTLIEKEGNSSPNYRKYSIFYECASKVLDDFYQIRDLMSLAKSLKDDKTIKSTEEHFELYKNPTLLLLVRVYAMVATRRAGLGELNDEFLEKGCYVDTEYNRRLCEVMLQKYPEYRLDNLVNQTEDGRENPYWVKYQSVFGEIV